MNNTLLIKGKGLAVGILFAVVENQLPDKARHTSIKPKWWHRTVRHELRMQNVTTEEYAVMRTQFFDINPHLQYEFF